MLMLTRSWRVPTESGVSSNARAYPLRQLTRPVSHVGTADHDGEFIATQPSDEAGVRDDVAQSPGYGTKQLVATSVPQRIVDLLEFVEVHHQQCNLGQLRLRDREFCAEMRIQGVSIGKARERVALREVPDPFRLAFPDRNIPQHRAVLNAVDSLPFGETSFERKHLAILPEPFDLHQLAAGRLKRTVWEFENRERSPFRRHWQRRKVC